MTGTPGRVAPGFESVIFFPFRHWKKPGTRTPGTDGTFPVFLRFRSASTSNWLSCASVCSTSYDTAGNTISNGSGAITYDAENRILTTNGVTYTYDGDGKRVEKSSGTLYWTGVGSEALSESTLSGTINEEYVFFNGERVSRIDRPSDTVHAFLFDHLGSSRMSLVPNGTNSLNPEEDLDYTPYGIVAYGTPTDHYQFTGKEYDSESGLNNFGARYDAALLGRFMTPDWSSTPSPVPFASPKDPQTLNLYGYERNNPLRKPDIDGHSDAGTFQNQCMHSDSCRAAQFQYMKDHPLAATLTPVVVIGGSVVIGMFGPEAGAAALVRFAPLLTAAGSALQTARDQATNAIQSLKSFDLSTVTSSRVSGALNSLSDHVTDMDIKGAIREANGLLQGNHATGELQDTVNSLSNLKSSLQGALNNPGLADDARTGFQQAVTAINNFVQAAQPVINQARQLQQSSQQGAASN